LLEISSLRKSYPGVDGREIEVLTVPKLSVKAGQQAALAGPSGSGKTTLLNIIAGITRPSAGQVLVKGQDLFQLPEARRDGFRAANIGYVFQKFNLLEGLSALDNVLAALYFAASVPPAQREKRARYFLERVGIAHRLSHVPRKLSSGEQQRVAVARALVNRPAILLADEPTANLDRENAGGVLELIREVCAEEKTTLFLATHDQKLLAEFSQVIQLGRGNTDNVSLALGLG